MKGFQKGTDGADLHCKTIILVASRKHTGGWPAESVGAQAGAVIKG
jgi:hypothetical protein